MLYNYIDIETLPAEDVELIAELAQEVKPPRTMSKAETIARWEADEKPALVDERMRATALDGSFGRVLAINYAFADAAPNVFIGDERAVLAGYFIALRDQSILRAGSGGEHDRDVIFVGHNVSAFDLRFLWQRAVINGIRPPIALTSAAMSKPWGSKVHDTMLLWNPERDRRISMHKLCRALGVESPKGELNGAGIYDAWKAGRVTDIEAYGRAEIRALRECHRKMLFLDVQAAA